LNKRSFAVSPLLSPSAEGFFGLTLIRLSLSKRNCSNSPRLHLARSTGRNFPERSFPHPFPFDNSKSGSLSPAFPLIVCDGSDPRIGPCFCCRKPSCQLSVFCPLSNLCILSPSTKCVHAGGLPRRWRPFFLVHGRDGEHVLNCADFSRAFQLFLVKRSRRHRCPAPVDLSFLPFPVLIVASEDVFLPGISSSTS